MTFLRSLLSNNGESLSSTRFTFIITSLVSNLAVFGVWAMLCNAKQEFVTIPESIVVLYFAANGISYSGKLIQKKLENGNGNNKIKVVEVTPDPSPTAVVN